MLQNKENKIQEKMSKSLSTFYDMHEQKNLSIINADL